MSDTSALPPVLVVDDDESIRTSIADVLRDEGYPVLEAENGASALAKLHASERPCIVLLDLMMPVMNGWQVIDAIRQDPSLSQTSIVVVSAFTNRPGYESPKVRGNVRATLEKPIRLERLLDVVARYCGSPSTSAPPP